MAHIYLMITEMKDYAIIKVGYASNLEVRLYAYTTHNPLAVCHDTIKTYEKTKRELEKEFHREIKERGYRFIRASIDNKKTEWFAIDYDDPFYKEIKVKGLQAFKAGKNRKSFGEWKK